MAEDFSIADNFGHSVIAVLVGDIVGTVADRISFSLDQRIKELDIVKSQRASSTFLDTGLSIVLHTGILAMGVGFAAKAMDWITMEPASFLLFQLAIFASSNHLRENLGELTKAILDTEPTATAQPDLSSTDPTTAPDS